MSTEDESVIALANRLLDAPYSDPDDDLRVLARQLLRRQEKVDVLSKALCESVKLQSHYAGLLNIYDGGNRIIFQNAGEWVTRLQAVGNREPVYECANDECPWRGTRAETVHPKHEVGRLLCPECHEVVELAE